MLGDNSRFIVGAVGLMILVGVILPLMLAFWFRLHYAPTLLADGPLTLGAALAWGSLAVLPWLLAAYWARRAAPPPWPHLAVIVVVALLLRVVYLIAVDNTFTSDYRSMWVGLEEHQAHVIQRVIGVVEGL